MGLLQRLLRRTDHAKWEAEHPGKRDFKMPAADPAAGEEAARTRARMEQEMTDDGKRRESLRRGEAEKRATSSE